MYRTQREVVANDARKASLYRDAGKALAIVWQLDFQADPFAAVLDAVLALAVARERRGTGA